MAAGAAISPSSCSEVRRTSVGTDGWKDDLDQKVREQYGVIERGQAVALAPTRATARHELSTRRWEGVTSRIHRLRGAPRSPHQQLMVAVLDAGPRAVVSHDSAAALWGLAGHELIPAHVTRFRDTVGRDVAATVIHQARRLPADQITQLEGFPVTRPERLPFDLANRGMAPGRVERIVDRLWSDRLVSGRSLRRVLKSLPKRGFRGTALMREILEERSDDWTPPASGLESRVMGLLGPTHGPGYGYERQVDLGGDEWVGRVDFVNRRRKVVVEVQSDRHHAALSSVRDDERRFALLRDEGFEVVAVWEQELWHRPQEFLARVLAAETRTMAPATPTTPPTPPTGG